MPSAASSKLVDLTPKYPSLFARTPGSGVMRGQPDSREESIRLYFSTRVELEIPAPPGVRAAGPFLKSSRLAVIFEVFSLAIPIAPETRQPRPRQRPDPTRNTQTPPDKQGSTLASRGP